MVAFFATGQNLNLYNFCRSVKGYEDVYDSVRRCIVGNTNLKSVRDAQCKTEGFSDRLSDRAIREIMGEVERISQEFCCGIDNETVNKYCELVPGQNRFDICKGSCRAKKCAMGVPRIASTARELGWVNTKNGKGWRCSQTEGSQRRIN